MIRRIPREHAEGRVQPLQDGPRQTSQDARAELCSRADPRASTDSARTHAHTAALSRALTLLLSEELRLAPEHIAHVVERELLRVRTASQVILRLHPDDLAWLKTAAEYTVQLELSGKLSLSADAAVSRGGCFIASNLGEVDAQLETRLSLALKLLESGALG